MLFTLIYAVLRAALEAGGFFRERLVLGLPPAEMSQPPLVAGRDADVLPAGLVPHPVAAPATRLICPPGWVAVLAALAYIPLRYALAPTLGSDPVTNALGGLQFYLLGFVVFQYDGLIGNMRGPCSRCWRRSPSRRRGAGWPVPPRLVYQYAYLLAAYTASIALARPGGPLTAVGRQTMGILSVARARVDEGRVDGRRGRLPAPFAAFLAIWAITFLASLSLSWAVARTSPGRLLLGSDNR